jgi:hypothetical protein
VRFFRVSVISRTLARSARLKDATGLDAVRDDLASAVQHVPEPARVRLRISQRG